MGRLVLFKECEHTFRFSHGCKDTETLICRSAGQMVLELGQLLPRLPPPESNKRQASGPCPTDQQQVGGLLLTKREEAIWEPLADRKYPAWWS